MNLFTNILLYWKYKGQVHWKYKDFNSKSHCFKNNKQITTLTPTKILICYLLSVFLTTQLSQYIFLSSNSTRDPGAFEATIAFRFLLQVLLVIVLSIVKMLPLQDLCGDGAVPFFIQLLGAKIHTDIRWITNRTKNYLFMPIKKYAFYRKYMQLLKIRRLLTRQISLWLKRQTRMFL